MWAARFWAARFWAARFWAKVGADLEPTPTPAARIVVITDWRVAEIAREARTLAVPRDPRQAEG